MRDFPDYGSQRNNKTIIVLVAMRFLIVLGFILVVVVARVTGPPAITPPATSLADLQTPPVLIPRSSNPTCFHPDPTIPQVPTFVGPLTYTPLPGPMVNQLHLI